MIRMLFLVLLCTYSLSTFGQNQLENQLVLLEDRLDALDDEREKIYGEMDKTISELSTKEKFDTEAVSLIEGYINTRLSSFEEQLSKLETIEE